MLNGEIVECWGHDAMVRWDSGSLVDANIGDDAKRFLIEVGLPGSVDWTFHFGPDNDQSAGNKRYFVFGRDSDAPLCLDTHNDDRAVANLGDHTTDWRFVNCDVRRFAECLVHFCRYQRTASELTEDDKEIERAIIEAENAMQATDPSAFADPENWWPLVIEQMRSGFM